MIKSNIVYKNDFIDEFKKYFYVNDKNILEEKEEILRWLDDFSKEVVLLNIDRYKNLIPNSKYLSLVNFNSDIFTNYEKTEQKKVLKDYVYINKNKLFWRKVILFESFNYTYNLGLDFIPTFITNALEKKSFIDAWSYDGFTSTVMQKYKPKDIHLFEINKESYDVSKKMLSKYNNIIYNNIALYSDNSEYWINLNWIQTSLLTSEYKNKIKSIKLDDYVIQKSILNIGLIKIDTEWSEMDIIKWWINTIKKFKPVLIISIYHSPIHFFKIKPYLKSFNLGYKFKIRKIMPFDFVNETILIAY